MVVNGQKFVMGPHSNNRRQQTTCDLWQWRAMLMFTTMPYLLPTTIMLHC